MAALTPQNKKKRIAELIARLEAGNAVQARDINSMLTAEQKKAMDAAWAKQQTLRKPNKPLAITHYEKLLKQAVMLFGRYDKYEVSAKAISNVAVDRKAKKKELHDKTKLAIKAAQDYLLGTIAAQPGLTEWLDRKIELQGVDIGNKHELLPRLITSRSETKLVGMKDQQGYKTITDIKLDALRSALTEMDAEIEKWNAERGYIEQTEEQKGQLKQMLANLKKKSADW